MNTVTLQNVLDFIHACDDAGLPRISDALAIRRNRKAQLIRYKLPIGSAVKFTSAKKRSPYTYTAVLEDKRQTRATVRITGPVWGKYPVGTKVTVPFAMLEKA